MSTYEEDRNFANDLFDNILPEAIDWITTNMAPDDVFPETDLGNWAEANGYEKEEGQ